MTDPHQSSVVVDEVPKIGRLVVFASASSPGAERQPMIPEQELSIVDWQDTTQRQKTLWKPWTWFDSAIQKYDCGHVGPRHFVLRIWGRQVYPADKKRGEKCPDCCVQLLKTEAIRCCLCGFAILPGEPIAVYNVDSVQPKDFDFTIIDGCSLGCMMWDCCPSGGFFAGHWTGNSVIWYGEGEETLPQKAPAGA